MNRDKLIKPMGVRESIIFFGIPSFVMYITINIFVPFFSKITGLTMSISWIICGGVFVFAPLLFLALFFYHREDRRINWSGLEDRFRLSKVTKGDLLWMIAGFILIIFLTMMTISWAVKVMPDFIPRPAFMKIALNIDVNMKILFLWIPFFCLNIIGEELFWRGYIFPRQELVFGTKTWLINGILWLAFHIPFGLNVVITFIPALLIISWVVQRTKSTTVGILMHGVINGLAFLFVFLGVV